MPSCQEPFLSPGRGQAAMSHTNSTISPALLKAKPSILFIVSCAFYKSVAQFFNQHHIGRYSYYKNNLTPASFIQDIYTFSWWKADENATSFWMNSFSATKLFPETSLTASVDLSYNRHASVMEQQGQIFDHTDHSFGISPSLKWNMRYNLNFDCKMNAFFSGVSIQNEAPKAYISVLIGVTKELSVTSNPQHFYNKAPETWGGQSFTCVNPLNSDKSA